MNSIGAHKDEIEDAAALRARAFLARVSQGFEKTPFVPHKLFRGGHTQTMAAYFWPRPYRLNSPADEERLFEVEPGAKVLAHCTRLHFKKPFLVGGRIQAVRPWPKICGHGLCMTASKKLVRNERSLFKTLRDTSEK